uniref:Uncharacterized protein n=1 Tax=viral metagenome TaxID=1070528 RepID=A0A6C0CCG6_9ZZZZ
MSLSNWDVNAYLCLSEKLPEDIVKYMKVVKLTQDGHLLRLEIEKRHKQITKLCQSGFDMVVNCDNTNGNSNPRIPKRRRRRKYRHLH